MNWIKKRFAERSTWAGIITLASIAGYSLDPKQQELVVTLGTSLVALIFTFTADKPTVVIKNEQFDTDTQRINTPDLTEEQLIQRQLEG